MTATELEGDMSHLLERHAAWNIPEEYMDIIWTALHKRKIPRNFLSAIAECPSLLEFRKAIALSKKDSAAGLSDLSYNMLKIAPLPVITAIYDCLCALWVNKEVPEHHKWRWLLPIPKVTSPEQTDLRPLSLVEVSRKLWASILMRKVSSEWARTKCLNNRQHGFVTGRSMDEAVLEVMNTMETAKEMKCDLYMSSWDIKRAFDRVPKQLLIFAWIRLGVPPEVAEYLVSIDLGGKTVVRTPHAQHTFWDGGYDSLDALCFLAQLGAGQGTVDAPLNWNAVFDILLDALRTVTSEFCFQDIDGFRYPTDDTAAADDLLSTCGTFKALQKKANIVSAFCIVFGLDIATAKLRTFRLRWGNGNLDAAAESDDAIDAPEATDTLLVHTGRWQAQRVPLARDGVMKHLGVH